MSDYDALNKKLLAATLKINELQAENEALLISNKLKSDVIDTKEADVNRLYAEIDRLTKLCTESSDRLLERDKEIAKLRAALETNQKYLEHIAMCHSERLHIAGLDCEVCDDLSKDATDRQLAALDSSETET